MPDIEENEGTGCILDDLLNYPYRFKINERSLTFLSMPKERFRAEAFHDDRIEDCYDTAGTLELEQVEQWYKGASLAAPRYIFHHAFTMSTLLGRIMDIPDITISHREPLLLTDLAEIDLLDREVFSSPRGHDVLRTLSATLCRINSNCEVPVIKGCDSITGFIELLFKIQPDAKGLLMYSDLSTFMVSCLKVQERRDFARSRVHLFRALAPDVFLDDINLEELQDHQVVALLWFIQLREFRRLHSILPSRLCPMYCEDLFDQDDVVARKLSEWSGVSVSEITRSLKNIITKGNHAKSGRKYDQHSRHEEISRKKDLYRDEIELGISWLRQRGVSFPVHGRTVIDV